MPRRNLNNTGSIRKRTDGRYEGRYSAPDGTQRSVYGATFTDCQTKLKAAIGAIDGGKWIQPTKLTVADWLNIWLRDYQAHTSARTVKKYASISKQFINSIGAVKLAKLSTLNVRHMVADLQAANLTASSIRFYMQVFKTAINCAVEAGLMTDNPAEKVKLPTVQPHKFTVIDRAEIPAFMAAAQRTKYGNELITMLLTGLRGGELRGLKWSDIDFNAGVMSIQRQLYAPSYAKREFRQPKDGETRDIHLPQEAIDLLKAERKAQLERRVRLGAEWQEDNISADLVFRREDGRSYNIMEIYKATKAVGAALGFDNLHPHDLRHSYAVAALRSGIDVKTVQHNLGHKSATMTLDTYAAYTSDAGKVGAQKFSTYFSGLKN